MSDESYTLKDSPDFVPDIIPEDTEANGTLIEVKTQDSNFKDPETGEKEKQVLFVVELKGEQFRYQSQKDDKWYQKRLYGQTSTVFSNNSKCRLYLWTKEILGMDELPVGFTLKLAQLQGNPVRVVVGERKWKDKKNNDEEKVSNYIKDLLRPLPGRGTPDHSVTEEPF